MKLSLSLSRYCRLTDTDNFRNGEIERNNARASNRLSLCSLRILSRIRVSSSVVYSRYHPPPPPNYHIPRVAAFNIALHSRGRSRLPRRIIRLGNSVGNGANRDPDMTMGRREEEHTSPRRVTIWKDYFFTREGKRSVFSNDR